MTRPPEAMPRDALPGDVPALAAILDGWIAETGWMPKLHSAAETRAFLAGLIAEDRVLVADGGAGPVGFIALRGAEVLALYLAPGARGRGIGRALLDHDPGPRSLWTFQANSGAIRFYLRAGFAEIERTDGQANEERLPDIRLHRPEVPQ